MVAKRKSQSQNWSIEMRPNLLPLRTRRVACSLVVTPNESLPRLINSIQFEFWENGKDAYIFRQGSSIFVASECSVFGVGDLTGKRSRSLSAMIEARVSFLKFLLLFYIVFSFFYSKVSQNDVVFHCLGILRSRESVKKWRCAAAAMATELEELVGFLSSPSPTVSNFHSHLYPVA